MLHALAPLLLAAVSPAARPEPTALVGEALAITCPPLAKLTCSGSTDPNDTGFPVVTGGCDPVPPTPTFTDSVQVNPCPAERVEVVITRTWTATDSCGNSVSCTQLIDIVRRIIDFDIKAPSCPNPFQLNANGLISMTIVGSASNDVTQIDVDSIQIWTAHCADGPVAPLRSNYEDKATPFPGGRECACHTLGADGILDLNLHFRRTDVRDGLDLSSYPNGTFVKIFVTGRFLDGCGFLGLDCVRIQQ